MMKHRVIFYRIFVIFVAISIILSLCDFDHIFCESNFLYNKVELIHQHDSCSHHCFSSDIKHHDHARSYGCCDSEEPHEHSQNYTLETTNIFALGLFFCFLCYFLINSQYTKNYYTYERKENMYDFLLCCKSVVLVI